MAAEMAPLTVFPGQDLSHQGEAADRIFVLAEGTSLLSNVKQIWQCAAHVGGTGSCLLDRSMPWLARVQGHRGLKRLHNQGNLCCLT